jgi:hypothetical protein
MERHFSLKGATVKKSSQDHKFIAYKELQSELMQWQTNIRSQDTHQTGKKQWLVS